MLSLVVRGYACIRLVHVSTHLYQELSLAFLGLPESSWLVVSLPMHALSFGLLSFKETSVCGSTELLACVFQANQQKADEHLARPHSFSQLIYKLHGI